MKSYSDLPFATDNHEFRISWDKTKAIITCKFKDEVEAFNNPITLPEFKEMVMSAATKGIKTIDFNSNYSIEVQRHQWSEISKQYGVKITRISN